LSLTGVLAVLGEELADLVADLAVRELDILLGGAVVGHEGEETVVSNVELGKLVLIRRASPGALTSWYSWRRTLGTSMLWVDGHNSSSFLEVKMSMATKWTLA
jgi:hypothetical protein